ncbi:MAG: ATP-binding protein [Patescibacteria group bacterium]
MSTETLIDTERAVLRAERTFFNHFNSERTPSRGTLTGLSPTIITRQYPELIGEFLDMYNALDAPVRRAEPVPPKITVIDIVYNNFLVEKAKRGEVVVDSEAQEFRSRIEGEASEQLKAYAAYLGTGRSMSTDDEDDDEEIEAYASMSDWISGRRMTIESRRDLKDIVHDKKGALHVIDTIRQNVMELYGRDADMSDALLTELLLEVPFVNQVVTSQNYGEAIPDDVRTKHEEYVRQAAAFATSFSFDERIKAFEDLTMECPVDTSEAAQVRGFLDGDREYVRRLHELARAIKSGEWSLDDLYPLLGNTIFKRGKVFEYSTARNRGFIPANLRDVSFDDIAGYESATDYYKTLIRRLEEDSPTLAGVRIILVVGKPGIGKSLGVKAFLSNLPENGKGLIFNYQEVRRQMPSYEDLVGMAGMHPRDHLFVVLEDIDKSRGNDGLLEIDAVGTTEMPGNLHFIATTTAPQELGRALMRPGRVSKVLLYKEPTQEERVAIAELQAKKNGLDLSPQVISAIVSKSKGFTPAEVEGIMQAICVECAGEPTVKDVERFVTELKAREDLFKKPSFWNR